MRGFIDQFSIMFFDVNMYPDVMPNPFSVPLSVPPQLVLEFILGGTEQALMVVFLTHV